ncbi:LysR substrate-binding domain-containing protein [Variovorax sp. PBL-E5]|uniref:LysR substrate-binding domain-containing protein n=1 Tax=Variovorax sp. PBL-E5 TaxID=434014 RepID=UPI001315D843|nr:LysR substrate-binding domain-containing protein [Variovorax sp. PBL-E5]VTU27468.1 Cyn operon transcriptional activator [Variovorax sp. PBL-E5]
MRFDLIDLRLFLNIVDAGTITAGAQRTHMTLASASQRVLGMEDVLATPLLVREKQGVRATDAGRTLAHHARLVLAQMEQMRAELGAYGAGLKGQVRLLCNTSAMTEHLPEVLSGFLAAHPHVSVDLEEQASQDIADAVRAGLCDIGIVSDAVDAGGLQRFVFRSDHLVLVVARGHDLARRRRIAFAEIVEHEFVGLAPGSPLQEHLAQHAKRLGKRLVYRVRVRGFEAVCRMVEQRIGIGIVPQAAAVRCAKSMRLVGVPLTDAWAQRKLMACVRQHDELPLNVQRMLQHLLAGVAPMN